MEASEKRRLVQAVGERKSSVAPEPERGKRMP